MNNQTYEIKRWDAVLFGNNVNPKPIIYIKPDENLLNFAKSNDNAFLVKIDSTGSIYDNKYITGFFAKSSLVPNFRPVFFKETELYVIVLESLWYGYPKNLGSCQIFGLKGGVPYKEIKNIPIRQVKSNSKEEKEYDIPVVNKNSFKISSLICIFLIIIVVIIMIKTTILN